jgi:tripartite-type tricarboxylate transporter receptor subunit TctC
MRAHVGRAIAVALFLTGFSSLAAGADPYPSKTVRLIIPAAPGGASDTIGRLLASKLTTSMGQSFVPENVAGAGTIIASEQLARSDPDGYTVLLVTSSHAINAAIKKNLRYDPIKDFSTVSLVATLPDLLLVNPGVPAKSVAELIALARKRPGQITFGSAGTGSGTDLDAELFRSMAKIDLLHIPYKGGSPAVAALVGGQIQIMFSNPVSSISLVKSGRLRALAITSKTRSPLLPDVPTVAEAGVPGYESQSWYGVLVPAKTPANVVAALNRSVNEALNQPDVRQQIAAVGGVVAGSTPEAFAKYMSDDIARLRKLVSTTPTLQNIE